jgi:hypothetical protein
MSHPPAQKLSTVEFDQLSKFNRRNQIGFGGYGLADSANVVAIATRQTLSRSRIGKRCRDCDSENVSHAHHHSTGLSTPRDWL